MLAIRELRCKCADRSIADQWLVLGDVEEGLGRDRSPEPVHPSRHRKGRVQPPVADPGGVLHHRGPHRRPGQRASRYTAGAKRADYVLEYRKNVPLAVVEAKDNNHSLESGIQQAFDYASLGE